MTFAPECGVGDTARNGHPGTLRYRGPTSPLGHTRRKRSDAARECAVHTGSLEHLLLQARLFLSLDQ